MLRTISFPSIAAFVFLAMAFGQTAPKVWGQELSGLDAALAMEKVLVDAIGRAEKSVVAIARVRKELPGEVLNLELRPDPFGRRLGPLRAPQPTDLDFIPNQFATGVVIDRRGSILTAYHVLGEQSEYYVTTADRKVYRATIKGADPRSDLAVLAVDALDLVPITFGDASKLKKGRMVIALGNPWAIARDGQVCAAWGIVANLARKAPPTPSDYDRSGKGTLHHFGTLIQTDAKLNLGTSGGPLLNLKGQMVGLVTSLPPARGFQQAAGYAIPIDSTFRRVIDTLKQGREVEYGFLGIVPTNLLPQEVLRGQRGMRVYQVQAGRGTPAARGGLRADDVITAVGGVPIHDADGLVLEVGRMPVDSVVRLDVLRDGRRIQLDVTLGKYPVRGKKIVTLRPEPWRGMRIDYPTAVIDANRRVPSGGTNCDDGVLVTEVEQGSSAWEAGLRPGMFVGHVGRTAVRTPGQFRTLVAGKTGPVQLRLSGDENPVRTVAPGS